MTLLWLTKETSLLKEIKVICVIVKFRTDLPSREQDEILKYVSSHYHSNQVGRVHFDSTDPQELSLCYVYVGDLGTARKAIQSLQKITGVEYACVQPDRMLVVPLA